VGTTLTIHHGDCLQVMATLPDGSVDVVLTDPPYSSGTRREAAKTLRAKSMVRSERQWFGTDSLTTNGFTWLMRELAVEVHRLLRDGAHFRNQHELILHFAKGDPSEARRHDVANVIRHRAVRDSVHPTEKPVALLWQLITTVAAPGSVVLDPFAGSGSTLVAAAEAECEWIGIEREAEYVAIATARVSGIQRGLGLSA
jgi:DNA modification methylase